MRNIGQHILENFNKTSQALQNLAKHGFAYLAYLVLHCRAKTVRTKTVCAKTVSHIWFCIVSIFSRDLRETMFCIVSIFSRHLSRSSRNNVLHLSAYFTLREYLTIKQTARTVARSRETVINLAKTIRAKPFARKPFARKRL